jgi:hypothetical protein
VEATKNKGTKITEVFLVYRRFICNSLEHKIYDCPHRSVAQEMFRKKVSHVEPKKDEAIINLVLVVETRSQNPRLVLYQKKEPWKTKTKKNWGNE